MQPMLIAQNLVEYGLASALHDGMYSVREAVLRTSGFTWLGIAVSVFFFWKLISR
jgi:hypothetical protein